MRYIAFFFLSLAICFSLQTVALRLVGGKTIKSESNYFSSIARIQTAAKGEPKCLLLGSSITGRLPDRNQGFSGFANMGCDDASAVDTLRAIDRGDLNHAPLLIIEANTLTKGLAKKESVISKYLESIWFRVGVEVDQVGATARPSAFAYSMLLRWKIGSMQGPNGKALNTTTQPTVITESPELHPDEMALACELSAIIEKLEPKGVRCMLVMLPKAQPVESSNHRISRAISHDTGVPFWDLGGGISPEAVSYTDGIHMSPSSAASCMRLIANEVEIPKTKE